MSLFGKIVANIFKVPYDDKCPTCYALQAQLDHTLVREKILIDRLLQLSEPEKIPMRIPGVDNRLNKSMPFRVAQRIKEDQDRIAAKKLKDLSDLEKELKLPKTEAEAEAETKAQKDLEDDKEFAALAGIEDAAESHTA
jgi:hypothetical protein